MTSDFAIHAGSFALNFHNNYNENDETEGLLKFMALPYDSHDNVVFFRFMLPYTLPEN